MHSLGATLGRALAAGDLLLLEGLFGAGKTTFVQGLAVGLDVQADVTSPSFVLENQYQGRLRLVHIDLYRLERVEPALLDELDEHLQDEAVVAVEWPEQVPPDLRAHAILLRFTVLDDTTRQVDFAAAPDRVLQAARAWETPTSATG